MDNSLVISLETLKKMQLLREKIIDLHNSGKLDKAAKKAVELYETCGTSIVQFSLALKLPVDAAIFSGFISSLCFISLDDLFNEDCKQLARDIGNAINKSVFEFGINQLRNTLYKDNQKSFESLN